MVPTVIAGAIGGVLSALITLYGVLAINRWRIAEENVLKQRAQWREAVRSLIGQAVEVKDGSAARRIWAELALRLNPEEDKDKDDRDLVQLVRSLEAHENRNGHVRGRIVDLAAHILKHDWSRAKWEARIVSLEDAPEQTRCQIAMNEEQSKAVAAAMDYSGKVEIAQWKSWLRIGITSSLKW